MKKTTLILGAGLLLGMACAQDYSANLAFQGLPVGGSVGLTAKGLVAFDDLSLDARLIGDITTRGFAVQADVLANLYVTDDVNLYFGPSLGVGIAGGSTGFLFGGVGGFAYPVTDAFDVFAEGKWNNLNGVGFRLGLSYYF
ncbi:hypothetical protein [Deinococcus roseus]|uniref:Outer membrane protein beta-barrel domain-containing protein n=1 Tax=Deinococcus roseus TaxID=392414 RepID=A0ABQ2D847_9DEIO|nr:hypothetical protein [Deinococcus roseus]GGJ49140.1 hypothetical protein GCM10008938_38940 [Deinococcus roseus]